MRYILFFFLLVNHIELTACVCTPKFLKESQQSALSSELIFIGRVIEQNSETGKYSIEVIELFKGTLPSKIILGGLYQDGCQNEPVGGITWLIYGELMNEGLYFSQCGISRSFEEPQMGHIKGINYGIPGPPKPDFDWDNEALVKQLKLQMSEELALKKPGAVKDLRNEIENLRKLKSSGHWD